MKPIAPIADTKATNFMLADLVSPRDFITLLRAYPQKKYFQFTIFLEKLSIMKILIVWKTIRLIIGARQTKEKKAKSAQIVEKKN